MSINLNVSPYFDDYQENKDFYRILFRPGQALQAREATQLQTILQKQVERFGNHIFKNGSLVVGGQTTLNLKSFYLKIKSTNNGDTVLNGGTPIIVSNFIGRKIVIRDSTGNSELGQAVVVTTSGTDTLILNEIYGNLAASPTPIPGGAHIRFEGSAQQDAEVQDTDYIGSASTCSINDGIFFIEGTFVRVESQTVLVDLTSTPSKKIGLVTNYTFVTENEDTTLNDNAQGFENYAAPGAHRLKIYPTLSTRDLETSENMTDFIELMRVDAGTILKQIVYPQYSELEKTLARRTDDESGSYTVNPFRVEPLNQFRGTGTITIAIDGTVTGTGTAFTSELEVGSILIVGDVEFDVVAVTPGNDTQASIDATTPIAPISTASKFFVKNGKKLTLRVSPGKAYVKGMEFETIAPNDIVIEKARTVEDVLNHDFPILYGGYVVVDESQIGTSFNFSTTTGASPESFEKVNLVNYANSIIGTARVRMISKSGSKYYLYLFEVNMTNGNTFDTVRFIARTDNATEYARIDMDDAGYVESIATGTVSTSGSSTTLTGYQTKFLTELKPGSKVIINNVGYHIESIASDTSLTLASSANISIPAVMKIHDAVLKESNNTALIFETGLQNVSNVESNGLTKTFSNTTYYIRMRLSNKASTGASLSFSAPPISGYEFYAGLSTDHYQLFEVDSNAITHTPHAFSFTGLSGGNKTLTLSGTFNTASEISYVLYATLKVENATLRTKNYKEYDTFITLVDSVTLGRKYLTSYAWVSNNYTLSLGISDVQNIEAIWLNPTVSGGVITGGENVTNAFTLDNGQRDTHYDFASITLKPEYRGQSRFGGSILVLFNYWEHSATAAPIASVSYSNYDIIPAYTSPVSGKTYMLRDCLDFRPVRSIEAANNDNKFIFSAELPLPSSAFTGNGAYYKGRKDRLVVTPEKNFKVLTGIPAVRPALPSYSENVMPIYNIELNPYTYNEKDLITTFIENRRYTMRDIGKIDNRLRNVEYYTALSLLEKETSSLQVKDGAGNTRFKNGFLVDNFSGHNVGDVNRSDYACAIDYENNILRPKFKPRNFKLHNTTATSFTNNSSLKAVQKGNVFLIPYKNTKKLVSQLNCSGFVNVNPYSVFSWSGQMKLDPTSDFWAETKKAPDVIVNVDNVNANFLTDNNFEGTRWNDWEVNWTGTVLLDRNETTSVLRSEMRTVPGGGTQLVNFVERNVFETSQNVGVRTRTGVQQTITTSTTERSSGERVVDVSVVPFIRAKSISVIATSLKPNTRIYVFFDGVNVSSLVTPTAGFGSANNLRTNSAGTFQGTLALPDPTTSTIRFRTGNKLVRITDSVLNDPQETTTFAEATYAANGVISTVEETISRIRNFEVQRNIITQSESVESSPVNRLISSSVDDEFATWVDPVAQTFLVDPRVYKEGVFLSKVTVFFRNKEADGGIPVTLQIRPTVNGFPHSSLVMPFGSKTLQPTEVTVPDANEKTNNNSIVNRGTIFEFDTPVFLQPGEYSIVILANSNNYEVYTAEIGQKRLGQTEIISEQPYAGSFFISQNSSTWTPMQTMDLMMELNICEFTANTDIYAEFVDYKSGVTKDAYDDNTMIHVMNVGNTIQSFQSNSLNHYFIGKTKDVAYPSGNPPSSSNFIEFSPNTNVIMPFEREITTSAVENFRYGIRMRTTNKYVSPVIDGERVNLICVENLVNNVTDEVNVTHTETTLPVFTNKIGTEITIGSYTGILKSASFTEYTFDGSSASVVVVGDDTIEIGEHTLVTGDAVRYYTTGTQITGLTSSVLYFAIVVNATTIKLAASYVDALAGTNIDLTAVGVGTTHKLIANFGTLYLKKTGTANVAVDDTVASDNPFNCTVTSVNSETGLTSGASESRYITKVITFKDECDYLKTYLTALKQSGVDIKVYYKILSSDSSESFDNVNYVEMIQEEPVVTDVSKNDSDFKEFIFTPSNPTSIGSFTKLIIKIVMLSDNKCIVPKITDMRTVALDIA